MTPKQTALLLLSTYYSLLSNASPIDPEKRVTCSSIHIFGARETTASAGYGSSITVVDEILNAYPGSTAEAIVYPACGGQASCGDVSYSESLIEGTAAAAAAVNAYNEACPSAELVLVGYSQGAEIFDNAFCGGGDPNQGLTSTAIPISTAALAQIKAVILQGDPEYVYGLSYDVGSCTAGGFDARSSSFVCAGAAKIQSYCDATDPYCCNGDDLSTHEGYGAEYGAAALAFVESKLGSGTVTTTAPATASTTPVTGCSALYGQCGGIGWTGATCCSSGACEVSNSYYSQCL
ncbi:carbohydrate esterase family 5 /Carbohydrate-binding module family 1 [Cryphonectria parasitica EP155]|uniref:Carbohydrate esterase family 5 /Carbohydrate-binding module family 1 n=1 Tax=Cryphonectria parasitica (strain ATCC 38755 / EP155) TaxID=660469 RepID=A0A9P4XW77_CRYP1|nr:carbohydrate esterase family 5 /Carbohydrate-binding module family 1 [Cryphonectria parasitica EP155]KAF3762046.1 carbohydrate esterase family 5 /Carbohydrate-binding module family 1 [Cryphonectria parasitica EP155]